MPYLPDFGIIYIYQIKGLKSTCLVNCTNKQQITSKANYEIKAISRDLNCDDFYYGIPYHVHSSQMKTVSR